jgi:hypothetical protein
MTARTHPFRRQATASVYWERGVFWALRVFTYIILAFGLIIFSVIIYKGSPAVFGSFRVDGSLPFIHNDFLFTKPQTLHVFKYNGQTMQLSAEEFYAATTVPNASEGTVAPVPAPAINPGPTPASQSTAPATPSNPVPPSPTPSLNGTPSPVKTLDAATGNPPGAGSQVPASASGTVAPSVAAATPRIDPDKITDHQTYSYAAGGIWPQIVGTVLLVIGSMTIALVLGICSAVYLSEYSRQGPLIHAIRLAIVNLAGVPSIVFGLFGVGLFVLAFKWNVSLMAGWFTLAFMVLPVIITASEESLRAVVSAKARSHSVPPSGRQFGSMCCLSPCPVF